MMAARLQAIGVSTLVIERNARIGDNWRNRYEALSLHFPHWADHLPYMPYPAHWPVYTPAAKLGNWLEYYSDAMELHCWTGSEVTDCKQNPETDEWTVTIERGGQGTRVVKPKHIVSVVYVATSNFLTLTSRSWPPPSQESLSPRRYPVGRNSKERSDIRRHTIPLAHGWARRSWWSGRALLASIPHTTSLDGVSTSPSSRDPPRISCL